MSAEGVAVDRRGAVAVCRIEGAPASNALSPALMAALAGALEGVDGDDTVRCIVVAGTGDVFATGADPHALGVMDDDARETETSFWERLGAIEKPLVAAVSGWALGAGCELAFACDLVVAGKTARFGQPEVTLGMIPGGGATQRLTRVLGKQLAMELILTGRRMSAEQAHGYGLVNTVAGKGRCLEQAVALAQQIADRAPIATRLAKRAILAADRVGLDEGMRTERALLAEAMETEDRVEGVSAFLEGRPPEFRNR